jgi:hypothetical protein
MEMSVIDFLCKVSLGGGGGGGGGGMLLHIYGL